MRALLVALALAGCREKISFDTPIPPDDAFPWADPDPADLARWEEAAAWSEARGGQSILIIQGDAAVFARQAEGFDDATPLHIFSGTKSFSCALALAMLEDGMLALDEPVAETIDEWRLDPAKEPILVEDLLRFTSGLAQDERALTLDGFNVEQRVRDKYAWAAGQPVELPPGSTFDYGSVHLMAFGELASRKLQGDPLGYLEERVLDPIGLRTAGWIRDPAGNPALPYGAWTTAWEWAKYGVLARDDGMWHGERVLPEGAFAACREPSPENPAYGLTFWLNADPPDTVDLTAFGSLQKQGPIFGDSAPADLFVAAGFKDNRLWVIPSRDLVIVRLARGSLAYDDAEMLRLLLGRR